MGIAIDTKPRRLGALIAGTAVVAVAAFGLNGGFGQRTASRTVQLGTLRAGAVSIAFDQTSTVTTDVTDLLPGRSTQRSLTLRNNSDVALRDITMDVSITGSGAALLTSSNGLVMDVDMCLVPWDVQTVSSPAAVAQVTVYSCAGTTDVDADGRGDGQPLLDAVSLPISSTALASNVAAEADAGRADGNDMYLRVTYGWPLAATPDPASLPATATLTWRLTAVQRAGQER